MIANEPKNSIAQINLSLNWFNLSQCFNYQLTSVEKFQGIHRAKRERMKHKGRTPKINTFTG